MKSLNLCTEIFVPQQPDFGNKLQGNDQTVLGYKNGTVRILGRLQPHAEGPAIHVHTNFVEVIELSKNNPLPNPPEFVTIYISGGKKNKIIKWTL